MPSESKTTVVGVVHVQEEAMTAPADLDLDALERALRKVETPQPGDAEMRDMLLVAVAELRAHREREERLKPLVEAYRASSGINPATGLRELDRTVAWTPHIALMALGSAYVDDVDGHAHGAADAEAMTAKCVRCGQERGHLLHERVMPGTLSHGVGDLRDMPAHAFASPPPPAVPDVEACDGPFCAVCGAREPHPLDVCLNVLRQRLTAEQAELRAACETIAQLEEDHDHAKVDASQWRTSTNQHAASRATLVAIAEAAEATLDCSGPCKDATCRQRVATLRQRLAERGK